MEGSQRRQLLVSKAGSRRSSWSCSSGSSSSGCSPTAPTWPSRRCRERVVDPQGRVLYTGNDISKGQQVFLHNGLMEYGSAFGHGAYLGPDYTADYLRRASDLVKRAYGGTASDSAGAQDDRGLPHQPLRQATRRRSRSPRRRPTPSARSCRTTAASSPIPTTEHGLRPDAITDRTQLRQLTAFFAWTAWAASTNRPGHDYSYTNNWPPEPRVDNKPTANVIVWSVLSLIALLGGIGAAVRRLRALGAQPRLARPRAGHAVVPHARATSR